MSLGVAIVGAGLIGRKRAAALQKLHGSELKAVVDVNRTAAEALSRDFGGRVLARWQDALDADEVGIVVVSTTNRFLAEISTAALTAGKHVLCEKPLGRNATESALILNAVKRSGKLLKTGFNHRLHPALARARELHQQGRIGELMYLRCRYGHGGRPGYEREWRASKELCGGGEMLDQGVHVVDLFRWFAGDFSEAVGFVPTCFWDMEVEDNAFALFRTDRGVTASMHTSWTQWKNLFSFEVFGKDGYLIVEGLGGSYGVETLRIGHRRPEGGAPEEQSVVFEGPDTSWESEWLEFLQAIAEARCPVGDAWDGHQANRMIEAVYRSAEQGSVVAI